MSGNPDQTPVTENTYDDADRIVREILNNRLSVTEISPSGELVRAINRHNRNRANLAQAGESSLNGPTGTSPSSPERMSSANRRTRRTGDSSSVPRTENSTSPASLSRILRLPPSTHTVESGSESRRTRPRMTESDRFLEMHRSMTDARRRFNPSSQENDGVSNRLLHLSEMHQASEQLVGASSHLRALLDAPITNLSLPSLLSEDYSADGEANRAAKRRKVDSDLPDQSFSGVSYGHYGQVEPGKLNMEIDFCDGGMYAEENGASYAAANVLKNDGSVYCTKGNRCNLVLKHQGGTPFALSELIIKAPPRGYTAPVQQGMVFISMSSDDLLTRTAQYQIKYSPSKGSRGRPASERNVPQPPTLSVRHNGDGTITTDTEHLRRYAYDGDDDYRPAQIPSDFTDPSGTPPFQVTTTCSDDDSDAERRAPRTRHMGRRPGHISNRIGALRFEASDSDSDDSDDDRPWHESYLLGDVRPVASRRHSQPATISIALAGAMEAAQEATQEAVKAVGGNLMTPHAKFFIERDKSKCTVRFEPPVSGRFILLKMWSPTHTPGGNIDIQSVVVKGFAGPRLFPSRQMM